MKTLGNIFIAGIVILIIGIVVLVVALGLNDWSFNGTAEFETKTYTADKSDLSELDITVNAGPARTEFYDGDKIIIEYPENSKFKPTITESANELQFKSGSFKWYNVSFWGNVKIPETVIKLPKNTVFDLDMVLNAGALTIESGAYGEVDITVNAGTLSGGNIISNNFSGKVNAGSLKIDGIKCPELVCKVNAGSLRLESVNCPEINAKVNAGTLNLQIDGIKSEYSISVDKSAGDCSVSGQHGTTDKTLFIDISAGSATINFTED